MEIEEDIYNKYRDTPYKNPQNIPQDEQKDKASKNLAAYNEFLKKIKKSINENEPKRISDNIKLRVKFDKSKQYYEDNYASNINKNNDDTKNNIIKDSFNNDNNQIKLRQQHAINNQNNDKRQNVKYINDLFSKEIEYENKNENYDSIFGNTICSNNCFDTSNNSNIANNNNNNTNNNFMNNENDNKFINNNIKENRPLININENNMQNNNKNRVSSQKKDLFILTGLNNDNKNMNIKEIKLLKNNENLETIEQKLRTDPYLMEYNDCNNSLNNDNNNIINNNNNNNIDETPKEKKSKKYNFILTSKTSEKDKDIAKLKNDLNPKGELTEFKTENQIPPNNPINEGFIENQNVYENPYLKDIENNKNKQCIYIKAEPIETNNNNQINNYPDEEANLGTSSELIEFNDHNSEFTLPTGTNIDYLVKKRKCSPLLIALLLGSAGLLFLLYKCQKLREMLLNILKAVPDFFKGLLGIFGADIEDFLERYNDIFRLLGLIIMIIFLWFLFRMLLKFVSKLMKKKKANK